MAGVGQKKGFKHSLKTRQQISLKLKGRRISIATEFKKGMKPWNKGKPFSLSVEQERNRLAAIPRREQHYLWIHDRTKIKSYWTERNNPEYKQWRKAVKDRDSNVCRINNKDCHGKIVAHHILGWSSHPELRYQVNNGITLCHFHHPKKRSDEKKLSPFFKSLVAEMN